MKKMEERMFKVADKKKPVIIGGSKGFIIASSYFTNGQVGMMKKYDVYIKEIK